MIQLYDKISNFSSISVTKNYSTSFSIAVRLLAPSIRQAIHNIYGFVRVADEIVDTFHAYPQTEMLNRFEEEYQFALSHGISSNPIIHSFQKTLQTYQIDPSLVQAFLKSMRDDLTKQVYASQEELDTYIYGSADVVGLMCLKVFVNGNNEMYDQLKDSAMSLGSAFQKVNFLRDLNSDFQELHRSYFPFIDPKNLSSEDKQQIVNEIEEDFNFAYQGIKKLPKEAKFGVYVAYKYYKHLLRKIDKTPAKQLQNKRISVPNYFKTFLLFQSFIIYKLKFV